MTYNEEVKRMAKSTESIVSALSEMYNFDASEALQRINEKKLKRQE